MLFSPKTALSSACLALLIQAPLPAQTLTPIPRPALDSAAKADSSAAARRGTARAAAGDSASAQASLYSADSASTQDTVTYTAGRIRYRNDRFSLSDKALLSYKGSSLTADSIVYYQKDDVVEAMGGPLIKDPTNPPIIGYKMRYNLKTKVGEVYYGSSNRGNQTFNGMEVRRQRDGDIYIARGDFSTCNLLKDKHFFFYSRRMILEPKSKVLSGPIVMNIGDVPVAILPMIVMPLGTGRRSGLVQPKFGGDQAQGFYLRGLGYYWAINDYTDWLVSGDLIEGQRGTFDNTNVNSLYRYNKRYVLNGSLGGTYYMSEFDPTRAGWKLDFAHDHILTPDGKQTLKGAGRIQSDPDIVDRNAVDIEEKSRQTSNANLGYRRQFDWNQATFNANLNQDYNLTDGNVNRDLPDAGFRVSGPLFPAPEDEDVGPGLPGTGAGVPGAGDVREDPWYRKLQWSYDNRFNVNQVRRPDLASATTGSVLTPGDSNTYVGYRQSASLSGKYPVLRYFNLTPAINVGQLGSLSSRSGPGAPVQSALDPGAGNYGEFFNTFNTSLTLDTRIYGTALAPKDPWFGNLKGVRHTLSPSVGFTYAPKIDSNPRFVSNPKIGGTAFQAAQKSVNMGLGNDVSAKLASDSAEKKTRTLLTTSSAASYNFARDQREWSDINSTFSLYLTDKVALTVNTTHALYDDFAPVASRNALVFPTLTRYQFGWRKGLEMAGDFNSGVRIRESNGFPGTRFEHTPWSAGAEYHFDFNASRVGAEDGSTSLGRLLGTDGAFQHSRTHGASANLKINPTAGWQMSYDTEYNFSEGRFSRHGFAFHRILHCWEMDFRWNPVGIAEGWNFNIRITELPDIKLETSDSKSRRFRQ